MKRVGYLIEQIADMENLRLAFWKARRGKDGKEDMELFRSNLDSNLLQIRREFLEGTLSVGDYRYFIIYEPKERRISASAFRERVIHHAIINICHPIFERFQIDTSYATRIGKGQYGALEKAKKYTRQYRWFCKMDVRKYFDHIDHKVLYAKLSTRFKDPLLLNAFYRIIDSYHVADSKGLPIGNLTSQYFANFYLGFADHYVKEKLCIHAYVRYMDDMIMWDNDRENLIRRARELDHFLKNLFTLTLKPLCINATSKGLSFLGYTLFPNLVRLNVNSKKRFIRKYNLYTTRLNKGVWSQTQYSLCVQPLIAFTRYATGTALRERVIANGMGQGF